MLENSGEDRNTEIRLYSHAVVFADATGCFVKKCKKPRRSLGIELYLERKSVWDTLFRFCRHVEASYTPPLYFSFFNTKAKGLQFVLVYTLVVNLNVDAQGRRARTKLNTISCSPEPRPCRMHPMLPGNPVEKRLRSNASVTTPPRFPHSFGDSRIFSFLFSFKLSNTSQLLSN